MSGDYTQQQSSGEQLAAEQLSRDASTPPTNVPGYKMERFLGAGAFGQVWAARDLNTGRRVAIKFYLHGIGANWKLLSSEVKNLVALSSDRYIVQVLEVGWNAIPPHYVMEYVESGSLEDLLRSSLRIPVRQAVELFREMAIGLNHCHQKGVLHCDLKPANVLLDNDMRPRLADFGQSRMTRDQTPALGTLFYMAPEQADLSASPDARWDVYALGAILYRMITGNAPHRRRESLRKIDTQGSLPHRLEQYRELIAKAGVPREHRKVPGVDRQLADLIDNCLNPDPEQRFQNVQQVLQAIELRDATRLRRPLMLLGIVGPILLLLTTCAFAVRSLQESRNLTSVALQQEALGSCRFAAKFVSSTLESDLRNCFQAVEQEASNELVSELVGEYTLQHADEFKSVSVGPANRSLREKLVSHPVTASLNNHLQQQLRGYGPRKRGEENRPVFATFFVIDTKGTIIAIAYSDDPGMDNSSLARNFFYRSYFHGGPDDLPSDTSRENIQPLRHTKLSSPFSSTATAYWKVAVSTPIYAPNNTSSIPDGVFVATINLGDFRLLNAQTAGRSSQIAALVDSRPGTRLGTILQHPLLDERVLGGGIKASELFPPVSAEKLSQLLADGMLTYVDPLGEVDGGEPYRGNWIATAQPVRLPQSADNEDDDQAQNSDLTVLVQYKMDHVLQPVGKLVDHLIFEGAVAVVSILLVMLVLWYFVNRINESGKTADPSDRDSLEPAVTEVARF